MSSHIASMVGAIMANITSPDLKGIGPTPLPANALTPYITVQEIINQDLENMEGKSGLQHSMIQVNCWHNDYETAWTLRERVKGLNLIGTFKGNKIQAVNHKQDAELYDAERKIHQLITRLMIWFET